MNRTPNTNVNKLSSTINHHGLGQQTPHNLGNPRSAGPYGIASQITVCSSSTPVQTVAVTTQISNSTGSLIGTPSSVSGSTTSAFGVSTPKPSEIMKPENIKSEMKEEQPNPQVLRDKVLQYYLHTVEDIKHNFRERLQELFFIQSGGNMVDYPAWKVRPTPHLLSFMNVYRLDDDSSWTTSSATSTFSPLVKMQTTYSTASSSLSSSKPSENSSRNNYGVSKSSVEQYGFVQGMHEHGNRHKSIKHEQKTLDSHKSHSRRSGSMSGNTQEDIAGQVRHESETLHRISQLRKTGLWSASRLPKVYELPRKKCQWDFLLEEMQWLATDFTQEKKWKRNMAKKISRSVLKFHQDRLMQEKRVKKDEVIRMKRIASGIAKEVKQFWQQIEKVACYKQQSRQEEQRRKALDLHLNFIVDQTEKYSSWLVEGMRESTVSSPLSSKNVSDGDDEFEPVDSSRVEDDEATISEEEENEDQGKYDDELNALKEDSEIPIEDLIDKLPEDMLTRLTAPKDDYFSSDDENESESDNNKGSGHDSDAASAEESDSEDYVADEEMEDDDEGTIDVEERHNDVDHQTELDDLQKEGELPISELLKLYGNPSSNMEASGNDSDDEESEVSDEEDREKAKEDEKSAEIDTKEERSLSEAEDAKENNTNVPDDQLTSAAATAESLQPRGFTLSTTQVKTKVPFLLQHKLREYQHIGLDWLVTMFSKQLNGILADEMGLGKTIQTIALLAHLACEEECWGPHLIVVPTSVMLNWEFELKKWCPGFKILTYFGTQKERKLKRAGWSKPNAFHVCITSYKLVIQDHQAFRRRKWKYFILDEAQNIKNFKSQRWQMLLNFHSQRRLLLTGTPLQNSLMELWSLMHFLMPNIFQSHQDFKEWFSNPLTGMIEGSREYSESIIKRLHTVLRPFLLRRLKCEVELQMPKKYEHVVKCRLSKRQRFLYDEFMSRTKTKETLEAGNFLSVINILMQLRKVCNHPDLFELRPVFSPYVIGELQFVTASIISNAISYNPLENISLPSWNFSLADLDLTMSAFQAHRTSQLKVKKVLIEELSSSCNKSNELVSEEFPTPRQRKFRTSSSQFQPLANVSEEVLTAVPEMESGRSYLDVINVNSKTYGSQTVNDILLRQIEDSIDSSDIDVVNVDGDDDVLLQPAMKKPKIEIIEDVSVKGKLLEEYIADAVSPFHLSGLKEKARNYKSNRSAHMAAINERHCDASPVYGLDLHKAVQLKQHTSNRFVGALLHQYPRDCMCSHLQSLVLTPTCRLNQRKPITERFSLYVRPVVAPVIAMRCSHMAPSKVQESQNLANTLSCQLAGKTDILLPAITQSLIQFPETRLVQYDCGKLQALDQLLRELKHGKHRILIFTQMTKMLDVLERFLNYHGYIYLRLDGTTKVEQRQVLMERFNQDKKIFVFILSTRSGGIGVNLTGADTVIFYDSDWNPTMDAQAQDRCHRIGQTRDVHIYRLICDRTVEENILKKAHQKRLLGNIAIEGGNFTAAFFKQDSVKDLFDINQKEEVQEDKPMVLEDEVEDTAEESNEEEVNKEQKMENNKYEEVLSKAEEEEDVKAAQTAKAEQESELMEFNENVPYAEAGKKEESKVEKALATLESELKPIELFALRFMESTNTFLVEDKVEEAAKMLQQKKKEWELDHLQSLKEAEERKNAEEEDDMFFTYVRDETYAKHFVDEYTGVFMPIWTPPTPPRDAETEYVTDHCLAFLYETGTIPENHLPPTHYLKKGGMDLYAMKRNTNRTHYLSVFKKKRHRLSKFKSIFDKKALELLNKNKLKKSQKLKQKAMTVPIVPSSVTTRPDYSQQGPDWLINEDWALLQAVNTMSELPLDFQNEPVHSKLANWDLAADIVNSMSRVRRSARQCRDRYQNVILLREEGKLLTTPQTDSTDVKLKKNKKAIQQLQPPKAAAPPHPQQKTHPQFNQDHGKSVLNMHYSKFDSVKKASLKRKPTIKQPNAGKFQGSRHAQVLATNGISTDKTLNPRELANMRADRIANEKKQAAAAQQLQQHQTSTASANTNSQTQSTSSLSGRSSQSANNSVATNAQAAKGVTVGIVQASNTPGSIRGNLVFTSAGGASTLVVNPSGVSTVNSGLSTTAASFAAINRKMQNVAQNVVSMGQVAAGTTAARIVNAQTGQSTQIIPGLVQSKTATSGTAVVVSATTSNVVAPNLVAQVQRGATIAGTVGSPGSLITTQPFIQGKALTQQQIAILRQKAAQQQQQQQLQKIQQQQRIQQQKQQQLKLIQQQSTQQAQIQQANQTNKQVQPTIVATSNQLGSLTVQTMKAPVTLRGSVPQQIMTQPLTAAQHQQLLQQALKKQQMQQLHRGSLTSNSQIQQILAGQKLTERQLRQLQEQQRHSVQQQQQQQKFQQQVTATIVTQPKAQLVMTQVKQGQGSQSLKTAGQQIQVQPQGSLPHQILLRPTLTQGLPQQIQLRAMISQQSPQQIQRVSAGQTMQPMQAQVNLQTGTVVMQPQQVVTQQLTSAQVQVVSSLAQQQQRNNIQAAVQKQIQQQQQQQSKMAATGAANASTSAKPTQVQLQLQQNSQLSQQLQRQQVLSATPAQLSQVKAFVSQAQLQASLSRSNSPVGAAVSNQSSASTSAAQTTSSPLTTSIQLQAQQVSQQMRNPQLVQVQLKTSESSATSPSQQQQLKQQQLKQQLQQLQAQAVKQQLRQSLPIVVSQTTPIVKQQGAPRITTPTVVTETAIVKPSSTSHVEVETLGAETELSTDDGQDKGDDVMAGLRGMRTRSHKPS